MESSMLHDFQNLIIKYTNGTATVQELKILDDYYNSFDEKGKLTDRLTDDQLAFLESRIKIRLHERIHVNKRLGYPLLRRRWLQLAAALLLISGLSVTVYKMSRPGAIETLSINKKSPIRILQNKYITLTDGSSVVLREGSQLVIDKNFNQLSRKVTLVGEGYFDIKHDPTRKFIVHAGNVTTTVLGTAFNIKTSPRNVIVTVTRGLVKVERQGKQIGVLKPNMQLTAEGSSVINEIVDVQKSKTIGWAKEDTQFDNMPFGKITQRLQLRYSINISFKNKALAYCPITGKFNGTESLKQILNILCQTRNATYTIQGENIIIDGPGCN